VEKTTAVIAAISKLNGVEHFEMFNYSVDKHKFAKFLVGLRKRCGQRPICIFFDQLGVHRSRVVKDKLEALDMQYIYNACYYPDGNGIEYVFSKVKHWFKRMRLKAILNGESLSAKPMIKKAFEKIT